PCKKPYFLYLYFCLYSYLFVSLKKMERMRAWGLNIPLAMPSNTITLF
ncbi:hypothetical protein HPF18_0487, partial [Helicobacter pylori]